MLSYLQDSEPGALALPASSVGAAQKLNSLRAFGVIHIITLLDLNAVSIRNMGTNVTEMTLDSVMDDLKKAGLPPKTESPRMFDRISRRYDLLNHLLSFGQDIVWRRAVAKIVASGPHDRVLDLACGTCDLLLAAFQKAPDIELGIGIDPARKMLALGAEKASSKPYSDRVSLAVGDGMALPMVDDGVDCAMISFGIRNIPETSTALRELHRVLAPGGRLIVLEFSLPSNRTIRQLYLCYFRHILPRIGGLISGDSKAYSYLNKTVEGFFEPQEFRKLLQEAGFDEIQIRPLTFGVATIYVGMKV